METLNNHYATKASNLTRTPRRSISHLHTMKYRSRSAGQSACLKSISRTITMQGYKLAAITDAEKTKL